MHPKVGVFCYTNSMAKSFFFYDLETSGLNPRVDRIMQFAGQRTTMDLVPIGDPINIYVRLNDDTLPSPDALMVTGISPQLTVDEGYSEAEFARMLIENIFTHDTIAVGFNNVRFDDEFIRHILWRNFYDPYEWTWKDGRSRWDMLDVIRMTRALRPEGIKWPVVDGKPTNRLELLTAENGLVHAKAHDAMSDVEALIDVTRLIRAKQAQLYDYMLTMRDKRAVLKLVNLADKRPFVYTSGRYEIEYQKTTVALPLTAGRNGGIVVYDLRYDPTPFLGLDAKEIAKNIFANYQDRKAEGFTTIPVKELQPNRTPAVAPLGVLEQNDGWNRIGTNKDAIEKNMHILMKHPDFAENVRSAYESRPEYPKQTDPEAQLYDSFLNDSDRLRVEAVRNASIRELTDFNPDFVDERLADLLLHYKARNYPQTLSESEMRKWENWRKVRITKQLPAFTKRLQELSKTKHSEHQEFILQQMQLWLESIIPVDD